MLIILFGSGKWLFFAHGSWNFNFFWIRKGIFYKGKFSQDFLRTKCLFIIPCSLQAVGDDISDDCFALKKGLIVRMSLKTTADKVWFFMKILKKHAIRYIICQPNWLSIVNKLSQPFIFLHFETTHPIEFLNNSKLSHLNRIIFLI